jgi:hypothetical protein
MTKLFDNIIGDGIGSFARHGATMLGGYLAAQGLATHSQEQDLIGSLCFLASFAWSVYQKYSQRKRVAEHSA